MSRCSRAATFAALSILWCGVSASAETMRCQSVNGNVNCAGSGGVSCQTVNGKKVCTSGHGGVVQSFGGDTPSDVTTDDEMDDAPTMKQWLQRHAARPHPHSDLFSIDGD
jgi:hypothetical protein